MKNKKLLFIGVVAVIIALSLALFHLKKTETKEFIESIPNNFQIEYFIGSGMGGYAEVKISSNGTCVTKSYLYNNDYEEIVKETYIPLEEIHEYLTYAVRDGFFELNSEYKTDLAIVDAGSYELEIIIGNKKHKVTEYQSNNENVLEFMKKLELLLNKHKAFWLI